MFWHTFRPFRLIDRWTDYIQHGDFRPLIASIGLVFIIPLIIALYKENVFNKKK